MSYCLVKQNFAKPPHFNLWWKFWGCFTLVVSKNKAKKNKKKNQKKKTKTNPQTTFSFLKKEICAKFSLKSLAITVVRYTISLSDVSFTAPSKIYSDTVKSDKKQLPVTEWYILELIIQAVPSSVNTKQKLHNWDKEKLKVDTFPNTRVLESSTLHRGKV